MDTRSDFWLPDLRENKRDIVGHPGCDPLSWQPRDTSASVEHFTASRAGQTTSEAGPLRCGPSRGGLGGPHHCREPLCPSWHFLSDTAPPSQCPWPQGLLRPPGYSSVWLVMVQAARTAEGRCRGGCLPVRDCHPPRPPCRPVTCAPCLCHLFRRAPGRQPLSFHDNHPRDYREGRAGRGRHRCCSRCGEPALPAWSLSTLPCQTPCSGAALPRPLLALAGVSSTGPISLERWRGGGKVTLGCRSRDRCGCLGRVKREGQLGGCGSAGLNTVVRVNTGLPSSELTNARTTRASSCGFSALRRMPPSEPGSESGDDTSFPVVGGGLRNENSPFVAAPLGSGVTCLPATWGRGVCALCTHSSHRTRALLIRSQGHTGLDDGGQLGPQCHMPPGLS